MMTTKMVAGSAVTVNGKKYTVTRVGEITVQMETARGAWAALVKNAKSGNWALVTERDEKPVTAFEIAA